ncbi:MAG: GerW family sporulation protein [Oscillospiraceae bacterium]|nr:GerW family sporulation protein [Oscillospiraceae bacterium]
MENKKEKPINEMMGITMEKVKEMVDINSIIGEPIVINDKITIIPISKVSFGFASGGSDLPSKLSRDLFGGGAGAGVSIKPEGFLVINDGDVKMINAPASSDPVSTVINSVPSIFNKVNDIFKKKKNDDSKTNNSEISDIEDFAD